MIVGNINTERLQLNHILVPYGSKDAPETTKLKGKERSFFCFFFLIRTLS